mmetsp:Transcript_1873/g.4941  ORF Transcript_1873/g.4941 Transcript_1873/m.4941 type:complete len:226 (-) Transcript_1873:439-1116(-)
MDIRNKYTDHDRAPPNTKRSPRESDNEKAEAPAAAPPPTVKTTNPTKATRQPNQTLRPITSFPIRVEISGVNKTLVCVKKEARPDPVDIKPTFSNPCAKKFHRPNSMPDQNNDPASAGTSIVFFSCLASETVDVAAVAAFLLSSSKGGKKHKKANHPRVADNAAAVGGTGGTSYTNLRETFRVPYSMATSAKKNRPCRISLSVLLSFSSVTIADTVREEGPFSLL